MKNPINVCVYAVGGLGINLGPIFDRNRQANGFDHVDVVYVDTSDANMNDARLSGIGEDKIFRFPNLKGGGKDRRVLHPKIVPHIPDILRKFPPKTFNVVLHSSGGASGSTVGPELVREMLLRGLNVVVVQVGASSDLTLLRNTIGTLLSYSDISRKTNRSVISWYSEITQKTPQSNVDERALSALFLLSVLLSNRNDRVDATDLNNLLNYERVTSFTPEFSSIEFFREEFNLPEYVIPQSMSLLVPEENVDQLGVPVEGLRVEYVSDGILDPKFASSLGNKNLAALVYTGQFKRCVERLEEERSVYKREAEERNRASSRLEADSGEDGLIF